MSLPYPIDAHGYVDLPGTPNNYLSIPDHTALDLAGNFEFVVHVAAVDWSTGVQQAFCNKDGSYGFACSTGATLTGVFYFTDAPGTPIFAASSAHTFVDNTAYWLKMTRVQASGLTSFYWAVDSPTEPTSWTALGTATVAAGKNLVDTALPLYLGCLTPTSWLFQGRIYSVILRSGSTVAFHFDADDDLAGVPPDPPPPPEVTTFVPTVPTSQLVTVTRTATAVGQGWVTFPGTLGNYLEVADSSSLDILGALTVVWRERTRDLTPTRLGQSVLSKAGNAGQFSYRVTHGIENFILERSTDGTAVIVQQVAENEMPFIGDYNERWLWFCLTFDTVPGSATTRLWYSTDDSFTPPAADRWTEHYNVGGGAKTIFNGSSPLLIGAGSPTAPSLDSDIGYLSLRSGGSNTVLGGTEQWRLDANNLVNVEPDAASITPTLGGVATVVRTPTPKDTGFIEFPGTPGNYLAYPSAVGVFTADVSFVAKLVHDNWRPSTDEVVVAKWGAAGQRSYFWALTPTGTLEFRYTTDGTATFALESSEAVPDPVGASQWIAVTTWLFGTARRAEFWYSSDAVEWTMLGVRQEVDQTTTNNLFNTAIPLTIGSAAMIKSKTDSLHPFTGRILEVAGSDGTDLVFGGHTSVVERFRIGPEHLEIPPESTSFPAIGGTVTVHRDDYPVDFGVWRFPGTKGNYLQTSNAAPLEITNDLVAEVRIAPNDWTPQDTDRVLIQKWGIVAGTYGWQFLLTPTGRLKLRWSSNGTLITSAESTIPVPIQDFFAKRVGFSYKSTDKLRFWTSDDGVTWTRLGDEISPTGTIFNTAAPVRIGVDYWGALTSISIRSGLGPGGAPLPDTEVFLMDQGCLNLDPEVESFPATTGQTVTVEKLDTSQHNATEGWIDLPGTLGNYLSTPDHADLDFPDSMTVIIRIAPHAWTTTMTLLSKWSAAPGNFSYLFQMMPDKSIRFVWTTDGTVETTLDSPPVTTYTDGEWRTLAITIEMAATKTLRIWESNDFGNSWILRSTASTAFGSPTIHLGNAPLHIGARNNTEHFNGRISYLDMRSGIGAGGAPGGTRTMWWSADSLHIDTLPPLPTVATFTEETGKVITINRANTPSIPGNVNFYGKEGDYASAPVPTLAATTGMTVVTRVDLSETRESADYLTLGATSTKALVDVELAEGEIVPTLQTPKDNIRGDVFIAAYLTLAAGATDQYLAAVWWPQTEVSWRLYIDRYSGGLRFNWSEDGINPTWASPVDLLTRAELAALGTGEVFLGVQIERNVLGDSLFTVRRSLDGGGTWVPYGTQRVGPLMDDTWIGSAPFGNVRLTIGGVQTRNADTATEADMVTDGSWLGRIRWVQMLDYPSDDVIWRFDSTEYDTGLEFTDGRERTWRLDSTAAITQLPPPDWPAEQIIVQRWDDTVDCSFSLRSTEEGFSFMFSEDGTLNTGGSVTIPMDFEQWQPDENAEENWGWLAVTLRFVPDEEAEDVFNGLIRTFHALDTGDDKVPTVWTEIDTQLTAPDVAALFVDTAEPVTIGGGADGLLPLIGRVSHLSLREGSGVDGTVGGTERFRIDMNSLYNVAFNAATFTAGTGQTVSMLPNTAARFADIDPTPDGRPTYMDGPDPDWPGSPAGPSLYLDPAPPGPELEVIPASDGPVVVITPSPAGPTAGLVSPSLDRGWWPGRMADTIDDPTKWWTQPAFTVQRQLPAAAGDYVRGSSNVLTEQTALRFPTSVFEGWSAEGLGKGILYASPHPEAPYDTVKLEWNFPVDLTTKGKTDSVNNTALDPWLQVAIVRSAFGAPTTVNDGQTIFLATKSQLFPGGKYILDDDAIMTQDVYDPRQPSASDDDQVPRLPSGRWYYYSLFFMIGQQWYRAGSDTVLLPRNHHHAEHLWDGLPPYYRWLDEQQGSGRSPGHLQKFLTVFGYDFDLTRELVESWQNVYHTDFTPMSLLRRVGENFGYPYESTIGDIRYRALIAKLGFLYHGRGTTGTLRRFVSAASKCDCDVTVSNNILLLPDDSDFYAGTGNWAGLHPDTPLSGSGIPSAATRLKPDKIRLDHGTRNRPDVPAEMGRGSMHVWTAKADETSPFVITCGDGQRYVYDTGEPGDTDRTNDVLVPPGLPTDLAPRFHGVYVKPEQALSFSFFVRADPEAVNTVVEGVLLFFNKEGQADDLVAHELNNTPISLDDADEWYEVFVDGAVPPLAVYCVPAIIVTARPAGTHATLSPMIHFAGAQLILQGTIATVSSTDPSVLYLTLDYAGELIGDVGPGLTDEYLLGDES